MVPLHTSAMVTLLGGTDHLCAEPSVGEKHYISVIIAAALVDNGNRSDYQQQCSFLVYIIYLLSKLHTSGFPDLL